MRSLPVRSVLSRRSTEALTAEGRPGPSEDDDEEEEEDDDDDDDEDDGEDDVHLHCVSSVSVCSFEDKVLAGNLILFILVAAYAKL